KSVGFEVNQVRQDYFNAEDVTRCGLSASSVLYIVEKPSPRSLQARARTSEATSRPQLAITGGTPRFQDKLHVGRPNIGDKERLMQRFEGILDRRWFTNDGPMVREFEQRIISVTGAKHCISMCNATVALEIAIRALELCGEVILPSYTFVAPVHALQWQEITPVFAD